MEAILRPIKRAGGYNDPMIQEGADLDIQKNGVELGCPNPISVIQKSFENPLRSTLVCT